MVEVIKVVGETLFWLVIGLIFILTIIHKLRWILKGENKTQDLAFERNCENATNEDVKAVIEKCKSIGKGDVATYLFRIISTTIGENKIKVGHCSWIMECIKNDIDVSSLSYIPSFEIKNNRSIKIKLMP